MATDPSDLRGPGAASPLLVLNTKLHAPSPRANRVHRQRLLDRLEAGGRSALALISAPAGFGKSTLVGDWLSRRREPSAWLSLDAGDSDLRRFLAYMVAALDRPLPGIGRGVAAALAATRLPDPDVLLTPLLNELWDKPACFLVLDDYHVIEAPEVHEALTFLLEHLPPEMHLILATRVDPPLPLPRLRARNLLCELRAEDLRFTHEEAALFLRETMGLDVAAHEIEALESRTEGWIAGLQMAALSLQGRDDVSAFIAGFTGSHRFVLDYLSEEVLDRQPPERMEFLLRTSILGRMSGSLCDAVTGAADGQEVLESLETANLFLIPLDDRRGWYRYHHLFATLLQEELRRRMSGTELAGLHARAAGWFAGHGLPDEAMEHAVAARDWERAVRIVEEHAHPFIHRGELATVRRWFDPLPEESYRKHPRLLITRALLYFAAFRFPEFAATVQELERACESSDDPVLPVGLDSMRALMLSGQGDHAGVVAFAGRALERMPEQDDFGAGRGLVTLLLGMSLGRVGEPGRALEMLEESARLTTAAGNLVLAVLALSNQGRIEILSGRLRRGQERYRQALDLFNPFGDTGDIGAMPLPAASQAWSGMAEVHLEKGELDQALEHVLTANRLSRSGEVVGHHVQGLATMVRVRMARGEYDEARRVYEELGTYMRRTHTQVWDVLNESLCHRIDVRQAKREGRRDLLSKVQRWAEERGLMEGWDDLRSRLMPDLPKDYAHLTVAHWLHACGRHREALRLLAALQKVAEEEGLGCSLIEIGVLEALVLRELGEPALEPLESALARAEPEGYVHAFVKEGEPLARLLDEVEKARPGALDSPFGRRLRELLGSTTHAATAPAPRAAVTGEPLSERELEVLRSVASGLSNAEAARRLYLSPFTVKKHLENIYGKLGVRNRTEAIARVQALGLLAPPGA